MRVREGSIIKVLAVEPKTHEYLMSNETADNDVLEKCKSNNNNNNNDAIYVQPLTNVSF